VNAGSSPLKPIKFGSVSDYRDDSRRKTITLKGVEFIRRYLRHVLPKEFMQIRHFGFLANRCRRKKLAQIRHCLGQRPNADSQEVQNTDDANAFLICPTCRKGHLQVIRIMRPRQI